MTAVLAFLLGNLWRTVALSALLALSVATLGGRHLLHQRDEARAALLTSEVARAAAIQIWTNEIDRLTRNLADAKADGEAAIAAKAQAEKVAADKLKARERYWNAILAKPENRAWAESEIPPEVLGGLR